MSCQGGAVTRCNELGGKGMRRVRVLAGRVRVPWQDKLTTAEEVLRKLDRLQPSASHAAPHPSSAQHRHAPPGASGGGGGGGRANGRDNHHLYIPPQPPPKEKSGFGLGKLFKGNK